MGISDGGDEDGIDCLALLIITNDQPCFDTPPPEREGDNDLMRNLIWIFMRRIMVYHANCLQEYIASDL